MSVKNVSDPFTKEEKEKYKNFFSLKTKYETKFIELDNGEIYGYRESGIDRNSEKPIIIFMHGMWSCSIK